MGRVNRIQSAALTGYNWTEGYDTIGRNRIMPADAPAYLPRHLAAKLSEALVDTPVVCLLGARQCGKSTLSQHCDPERAYITLDDRNYLSLALSDPEGFLASLPERVTIDEIQRAPELTLAIKRSVDAKRRPGRFLLTGSANLLQLPRLADSLAGRMECLFLHPLTESEKNRSAGDFLKIWVAGKLTKTLTPSRGPTISTLPNSLVAGGFPEASLRSPGRARTWQQQYVRTIIERDIHDVADVKDGQDVARLLEYLSNQTASLLNLLNTANALGHTRPTIERHISILEKLFLVRRLPAWHSNRNKRLIKTPKIHLCDSGLVTALSDLRPEHWNQERTRFGHVLESFVVQQIIALGSWHDEETRFYHYRDKDLVEVDLVIEMGGGVWGVEVKAAASVQAIDGKGLRRLAETAKGKFRGGIVLYDGDAVLPIDIAHNLYAVPLSKLWEL